MGEARGEAAREGASRYRPERWKSYRSDYRFTGKEEDIEVGLAYFGARYYAPALNRWISADPLAVHEPGEADLNVYAYVHGRVYVAVDPNGQEGILAAIAIGAAIGAALGGAGNGAMAVANGAEFGSAAMWSAVASGALAGAAAGAVGGAIVSALGPGLVPMMVGGAASGVTGQATLDAWHGKFSGWEQYVGAAGWGAVGGAAAYGIGAALKAATAPKAAAAAAEEKWIAVDPEPTGAIPGVHQGKTIGPASAVTEPFKEASRQSAPIKITNMGSPQAATPPRAASEPTLLPNSDQMTAAGGPSSGGKLTFGQNANQVHHAFRHTDKLGLPRADVQAAIRNHLPTVVDQIPSGRPLNQIIELGGQRIQYSAFRLPDGTINVGRIHGVP